MNENIISFVLNLGTRPDNNASQKLKISTNKKIDRSYKKLKKKKKRKTELGREDDEKCNKIRIFTGR
jgi:hypothetical protein